MVPRKYELIPALLIPRFEDLVDVEMH